MYYCVAMCCAVQALKGGANQWTDRLTQPLHYNTQQWLSNGSAMVRLDYQNKYLIQENNSIRDSLVSDLPN